jgi:hypothetical protein
VIDTELLRQLYRSNEDELMRTLDETPTPMPPVITQSDVREGFVIRYFIHQVTDNTFILEIDKYQYEHFKENPRFAVTKIKWKIVGKKETIALNNNVNIHGVEDLNKIAVANVDLTFRGLRNYITNYLEYWFAEEV